MQDFCCETYASTINGLNWHDILIMTSILCIFELLHCKALEHMDNILYEYTSLLKLVSYDANMKTFNIPTLTNVHDDNSLKASKFVCLAHPDVLFGTRSKIQQCIMNLYTLNAINTSEIVTKCINFTQDTIDGLHSIFVTNPIIDIIYNFAYDDLLYMNVNQNSNLLSLHLNPSHKVDPQTRIQLTTYYIISHPNVWHFASCM